MARDRHGTFVVGATYLDGDDRFVNVMDGEVDEVTLYHSALDASQIAALAETAPCAVNHKGEGWAYFPGQTAQHGPEFAQFDQVPACREGPHTVRFRYLVSKGQNRRLR